MCPVYEYKCDKCKCIIEEFKSINDNTKHIKCECGNKAKKIISSNSFILKGSGWYKDGYTKQKR